MESFQSVNVRAQYIMMILSVFCGRIVEMISRCVLVDYIVHGAGFFGNKDKTVLLRTVQNEKCILL